MSASASGTRRRRASRQRSCDHCLAWGMLTERLCKACRSFASSHPAGTCTTCGRDLPVDAAVCRPCRKQASLVAGPANKTALDLSVAAVTGHQLWFHFGRLARAESRQVDVLPVPEPPRPVRPRSRWVQLLLFDVPRDLSRVSAQLPPIDAGLAERLHAEARRLAELRGWSPRTLSLVQRGLRILMAVHGPGEPVRASTVRQLTTRNMPFPHIIDVLAAASMLEDDRPDTLTIWLDEQLAGLPPQISYGLDGAILGLPGSPVHLEIVRLRETPPPAHGLDQLVFYLPDVAAQERIMARLAAAGVHPCGRSITGRPTCGVTCQDRTGGKSCSRPGFTCHRRDSPHQRPLPLAQCHRALCAGTLAR